MKTIKCIYSMGVFALFCCLSGCNDDWFLREDPPTLYTVDNVFSSSAQIDQILVAVYAQLRDMWTNSSESAAYFDFKGKGTDMYDVASIRKGTSFSDYATINPNHETFNTVYQDFYKIIFSANLALYAVELPQISWASAQEKAYIVAQAKFFRAFAYRNLGELYGGVPIVQEIIRTPRYDFERASRIETYQFAIDDLESIVNDLPERSNSGGRVVRGAAQHTLCQLYLALGIQLEAEGKGGEAQTAYAKSINYGNEVINDGGYALMTERFGARKNEDSFSINVYPKGVESEEPIDTLLFYPNHYWDLFQDGNVNYQDGNTESIWTIQIDFNAYVATDKKSRLVYARAYVHNFRDILQNDIYSFAEEIGGRGISRVIPTMYTRNEIYEDKWAADLRNSDVVFRRRFKANVPGSAYYLQVMPWEYIYYGNADQATNNNNRSQAFPISCKITTDKFLGLDAGEVRNNLFRDDYLIRLPETILLRAEAKQRSGDKEGAAADINLLRNRSQCAYKVTAADMDDEFNMILDERARELVYEETRWNTLLRMGGTIAVDRIRKYAYWPETKSSLTFDYNLWPIPQRVIDTNKDVALRQNPGWTNR